MENTVSTPLTRQNTAVLLIDYQELLFSAMPEQIRDRNLHQATVLLRGAYLLGLEVVATEQYPQGLGPTLGALAGAWEGLRPYPKLDFSAAQVDEVLEDIEACRAEHILIAGMETHICVLQTVRELQARGLKCHVMADAVISRHTLNWRRGLALCEEAGAQVSTVEAVLFEILGSADADGFKAISRLIR